MKNFIKTYIDWNRWHIARWNNVAILITWVIKDDDNVYPQHFSEEALTAKNWWECGKS